MPVSRLARFLSLSVAVCVFAETRNAAVVAEKSPAPPAGERTVEQLTALVRKSVVVVSFTGRDGKQMGLGSGFVIARDGLIATNLHVIGEARPVFVQTADGKKYEVQSIHATERSMDLAVLKIDANDLQPLPLGDSDSLKQGQKVVALGNPQGLQFSVVAGVLSAKREIDGRPMLQLALPIERGNSGGPLLDLQGRVHGILTLKSLVTENLGYAVAINSLKPLLEKPNPVPMKRWLTIGALDAGRWTTLFGGLWRQRAGRIHVEGRGAGFGGRVVALAKRKPPKPPFEIAVQVKLDDEAGAAGLAFHADGENRHYGFYPSNGAMRISRFEGADVFSWKVLHQKASPHYRKGEWNTLKVRVEKTGFQCFVNDKPVFESDDLTFTDGRVGLAKFRDTVADFRGFRVAKNIPPSQPDEKTVRQVAQLVLEIPTQRPPQRPLVEKLVPLQDHTEAVLRNRAKELERQAERLKQLARLVHEEKTRRQLARLFEQPEDKIDLLKAALLVAKLDNEEVDVDAYLRQANRMAADVSKRLKPDASEAEKLKTLDKYLFDEMGFHGSRTDYYNRSNSYLNEVIDDREGLPIALSVLYMELARRLELKVVGVGLPGHFIVRFEPADGDPQLIDPFEGGKRLSRKEAEAKVLATSGRPADESFFAAQSRKAVVERMLRNLMGNARDANDPEAMLRYVNAVLTLNPDSNLDRWFRAVLNYSTGRLDEALADAERTLKNPPEGVPLERIRQLKDILEKELQESSTR